jgi:hypothetical protein
MIQGCGRRCCPSCRPSMRAVWRSAETPTGGSIFPVYSPKVPSPRLGALAPPPPPPPRGPQLLGQGQRGYEQLFLSGSHREVGGREKTPTTPRRWVFCLGPTLNSGFSQKRQRTTGETVEAVSQAQGTQRRVSPPPPPSSDPPQPPPPPPLGQQQHQQQQQQGQRTSCFQGRWKVQGPK